MHIKRTTTSSVRLSASEIVHAVKQAYPDHLDIQALVPHTAKLIFGSADVLSLEIRQERETVLPEVGGHSSILRRDYDPA